MLAIVIGLFSTEPSSSSKRLQNFAPGQALVYLKSDLFDMPLTCYGVYVSFPDKKTMKVEKYLTVDLRPDSREIVDEDTLTPKQMQERKPEVREKISISFPDEMISLFKKYKVYEIKRQGKVYESKDSEGREIMTHKGVRTLKMPKLNQALVVYFDAEISVKEFIKEIKKLDSVEDAQINEIPMIEGFPNDIHYNLDQKNYLGPNVLDFKSG